MKKLLFALLLVPSLSFAQESPGKVGPLALGVMSDWLIKTVKERGMVCATVNLKATLDPCGAVKTLTWKPKGKQMATIAVGGRFADENGVVKLANMRLHISTPLNLIEVFRPIYSSAKFKRNWDYPTLPKGLEIWVGPALILPDGLKLSKLVLNKNLGIFFSLGKKFGG